MSLTEGAQDTRKKGLSLNDLELMSRVLPS